MWSLLIVIDPPRLNYHPRLAHVVKPLPVETFISKTTVKALSIAILPGTTRLNVKRLHPLLL